MIRTTSKESLCNIPRRLPNLEKALALDHPIKITEYAPALSKIKKSILGNFTLMTCPSQEIRRVQANKNSPNINIGLKPISSNCPVKGSIKYFNKSLIPSNTGCNNPNKVTLLGPSRICLNPNTLRSIRVIKATLPKANKKTTKS